MESRLPLLRTLGRILTFRATKEELKALDVRFLILGLAGAWLVGIGRHWDAPTGNPARDLGLGSVIYVFLLALLLFVVGKPLRPDNWSYLSILTFVSLTSFPAALYAIPVERWTDMGTAQQLNLWFLLTVATYRLALFVFYGKKLAGLGVLGSLVATFVPILLILNFLAVTGLSGAVLDIMAGLRGSPSAQDLVNQTLTFVSFTSCLSLPVALIAYQVLLKDREAHLKLSRHYDPEISQDQRPPSKLTHGGQERDSDCS